MLHYFVRLLVYQIDTPFFLCALRVVYYGGCVKRETTGQTTRKLIIGGPKKSEADSSTYFITAWQRSLGLRNAPMVAGAGEHSQIMLSFHGYVVPKKSGLSWYSGWYHTADSGIQNSDIKILAWYKPLCKVSNWMWFCEWVTDVSVLACFHTVVHLRAKTCNFQITVVQKQTKLASNGKNVGATH